MTINQATLRDLCSRVASGDEQAHNDFNRYVPPLVEVVVQRWLRQQRKVTGASSSNASSQRARQVADVVCARMIAECHDERGHDAQSVESVAAFRDDTLAWR
jgi:hypothetical protein